MLQTASISGLASASDCDPVSYQGSEYPEAYEVCGLTLASGHPDGTDQCKYDCRVQIEYEVSVAEAS